MATYQKILKNVAGNDPLSAEGHVLRLANNERWRAGLARDNGLSDDEVAQLIQLARVEATKAERARK